MIFFPEIVRFQKCIDERRFDIPPDRKPEENFIVVFQERLESASSGRYVFVFHLHTAAGVIVHPVQIRGRIRNLGQNFVKVSICCRGDQFRGFLCCSGGTEKATNDLFIIRSSCFGNRLASVVQGVVFLVH